MSFFEAGMLICFGIAWPFNIIRSIYSRTSKGKSVLFLYILVLGYILGIVHKVLYSKDIVLLLYCLNLIMVTIDILLYYRNRRIDKKNE